MQVCKFTVLKDHLCPQVTLVSGSIDEDILQAGGLTALDVFHASTDSKVMVRQELDIMMSFNQYKFMKSSPRTRRGIITKNPRSRWPGGVVYFEIMEDLKQFSDTIKGALMEIMKYSCIRFSEDDKHLERIQVINGSGCWAELGYEVGKITRVSLGVGCRRDTIMIHEFLHSLAIDHEHSRPDRDKYIKILNEQLQEYDVVFEKDNAARVENFEIEYDYRSIMHFGHAMKPLDSRYIDVIGMTRGLSFRDIKLINLAYECAEMAECRNFNKKCPFNGFMLSIPFAGHSPCRCFCDSGDLFNDEPLVLCDELINSREPVYSRKATSSSVSVGSLECNDLLRNCLDLKKDDLCLTEMRRMKNLCSKTCDYCSKGNDLCMDHDDACAIMAKSGACKDEDFGAFMSKTCPRSCKVCSTPVTDCDIQEILSKYTINSGNRVSLNVSRVTRLIIILTMIEHFSEMMNIF